MRQLVLLLLGMLMTMPVMAQNKEPEPDYQAMRRYRISQLSEEDLNKFYAEAESEAETEYEKAMADHQKDEANTAKIQARCTETCFKKKILSPAGEGLLSV